MAKNIYWLRGDIGDAIWLWLLLNGYAQAPAHPEEHEWFLVTAGEPVGDGQLGQNLFACKDVVIGWRERLVAADLIRTTVVDGEDQFGFPRRRYEVRNLAFGGPIAPPPQHVN